MFIVCGLWLVALGAWFVLLRPAMLPEDARFSGATLESMRVAAPGLARWLNHVFDVLGGFMVASGALTVAVAHRLAPARERGTFAALCLAGAAGVGLISATNFLLHSDFRWLLLIPALLWLFGLVCYWREGGPVTEKPR